MIQSETVFFVIGLPWFYWCITHKIQLFLFVWRTNARDRSVSRNGSMWDHCPAKLGPRIAPAWYQIGPNMALTRSKLKLGPCWDHVGIVLRSVWDQAWSQLGPNLVPT